MKKHATPDVLVALTADAILVAGRGCSPRRLPRTSGDTTRALDEILRTLKKRTKLLVLNGDAWCQALVIPSERTLGLDEHSLAGVLAYEAETYSGQRADTSLCLCRALGGERYQVAQFLREEVTHLLQSCQEAGVVLIGVSHPAFLGSAPDSPSALQAAVETLGDRLPLVQPPPPPARPRTLALRALLCAGLALAICLVIETLAAAHRDNLKERLEAVERARGECTALSTRAANAQRETQQLQVRMEDEINSTLRQLRARKGFARILEALAATRPEGGLIQSISSEADYTLAVEGLTLTANDAELFLKKLGEALKPNGFGVVTLSLTSTNLGAGGSPWRFCCRIAPIPGEVLP